MGQTDHRAILQVDSAWEVLPQRQFQRWPLHQLAGRFFQQLSHQVAGSRPKALFDGLIAHVNVQGGHHMIELRITGRGIVQPS